MRSISIILFIPCAGVTLFFAIGICLPAIKTHKRLIMCFDCRLSPEGDRTDLNNYFTVTFAVFVTKSAMLASVKSTPFKVQFSKVTSALGSSL